MNRHQLEALADTMMRFAVMVAATVAIWAGAIWVCASLVRWLF